MNDRKKNGEHHQDEGPHMHSFAMPLPPELARHFQINHNAVNEAVSHVRKLVREATVAEYDALRLRVAEANRFLVTVHDDAPQPPTLEEAARGYALCMLAIRVNKSVQQVTTEVIARGECAAQGYELKAAAERWTSILASMEGQAVQAAPAESA